MLESTPSEEYSSPLVTTSCGLGDGADVFSVTLSRPSAAGRPRDDDVQEVDGLDLDSLAQDERDFLNSNYTTFLLRLGKDPPQGLEDHQPRRAPSQRWVGASAGTPAGGPGPGVWEDDMDLPVRPGPQLHPLVRLEDRRHVPAHPVRSRAHHGGAHGGAAGPRKRRKHARARSPRVDTSNTFFLTIE